MKQTFTRLVCTLLTVATIASFSALSGLAAKGAKNEYTPSTDSTWGDVLYYFDPQGYENLTAYEKRIYDTTLLSECPSFAVSSPIVHHQSESVVSSSGYIYEDSSTKSTDIKGFTNLTMGLSSTKDSIEYTTALTSTISCPKLTISMIAYNTESGKYVGTDLGSEENTKLCTLDDSFDDLESKTKYKIRAMGVVTPPSGYFTSGPLILEYTKETK